MVLLVAGIRVLEPEEASASPLVERTDVEALVNTVNTEGVMGKGIALAFLKSFGGKKGAYFKAYADDCQDDAEFQLTVGKMQVFDRNFNEVVRPENGRYAGKKASGQPTLFEQKPRWIINFPTKREWSQPSSLQYVKDGLDDLVEVINGLQIASIAMPALGCGNGGLSWDKVQLCISKKLNLLNDVSIRVYPPHIHPFGIHQAA